MHLTCYSNNFKLNMTMIRQLFLTIAVLLCVIPSLPARNEGRFSRGGGMMVFTAYEPMKAHPVNLYYYIPTQGNIKKMRVLFSMHGAERNGRLQRGVWRNLAEEYGFIVLAPEFKHDNGYLENGYQFGWVSEDPENFKLRPREVWTYQLIEAIFDYFKASTGNTSETYDMFGHSAGGQFVHRFLLAMPEARVGRAVAANPGNYTYPDERGLYTESGQPAYPPGWPFSVKGTPFASDDYLAPFFSRDLVILIGSEDREPLGPDIPENSAIRIQGLTRYDRAWKFYNASREIALRKGMRFNWHILEVPGAGHSSAQMVHGQKNVRNWRIKDDERVYNIKDAAGRGAFSLIFEQ